MIAMQKKLERNKLYENAAISLTIIAIIYLSIFLYNAYSTFHEYSDLGVFAYNLFFNINYPQIAHGLQYIVVGNHISPDILLIYPIFYLHESSLTLLLIQLGFVYASGFLIFLIARDLTKNSLIAFVLCVAFLIFPGTLGQVIFDAHIEFTITFFFLLAFYFYIKSRPYKFLIASLLLLGSSEATPILGATLGLALLLYEYRYDKNIKISKTGKKLAVALIILSIIATFFYSYVTSALANSYSTSYKNLYPIFSVTGGPQVNLGSSVAKFVKNPVSQLSTDINLYFPFYTPYLVYSSLLILFGFGISLFFSPEISLILILPWLAGVFVFQDPSFLLPFSEYFGFVIAPVISGAIIGIMASQEKGNHLSNLLMKMKIEKTRAIVYSLVIGAILLSLLSPLIYLYVISPSSQFHSVDLNGVKQLITMQSNQTQRIVYKQLNYVIDLVPENGSLLTEYFIMPHVINREYLDFSPNRLANPEYVLIDFNKNISDNSCKIGFENCTAFTNIIDNGNYSLYAQNGTAKLYKKMTT